MLFVSHQTGNRNVRGILEAAIEADWLGQYFVTLDLSGLAGISDRLPSSLAEELRRRMFADVPAALISSHGWTEALAIAVERMPVIRRLSLTHRYRAIGFLKSHDRWTAARLGKLPPGSAVYAYPCGALASFRAAERSGAVKVLEFTQAHWSFASAIMDEEAEINPAWRFAIPTSALTLERSGREDAELELADALVCPSRFVERTLPQRPVNSRIVGYGCPAPALLRERPSDARGPLKVLFVGNLMQQKGLSYLFDAMDKVGSAAELTIVGTLRQAPGRELADRLEGLRWYPSLPNPAVRALMREHDVLVLPSLCDAFGLVVSEALSEGAPVIVSTNVGAADLVEHGHNGFVVPIRDSDAIAQALLALRDPDRLAAMSAAAYETARKNPESGMWGETVDWIRSLVAGQGVPRPV